MNANKLKIALAIAAALALAACKQESGAHAASAASGTASAVSASAAMPAELDSEIKQVSYLFGQMEGQTMADGLKNMKAQGVEVDTKVIFQAMQDAIDGKAKLTEAQMNEIGSKLQAKLTSQAEKAANDNLAAGEKFLNENKGKPGVQTTASGLQYKVDKEGTGAQAKLGDGVLVEYEGKLIDGTVFDGNKNSGQPAAFPVLKEGLIPGFVEGLQLMKEGGEYTLYMPAKLAYGSSSPSPKIPANSTLIFNVKVVKVEKGAAKQH